MLDMMDNNTHTATNAILDMMDDSKIQMATVNKWGMMDGNIYTATKSTWDMVDSSKIYMATKSSCDIMDSIYSRTTTQVRRDMMDDNYTYISVYSDMMIWKNEKYPHWVRRDRRQLRQHLTEVWRVRCQQYLNHVYMWHGW